MNSKVCPSCKEKNNPSFSKCWKCGFKFELDLDIGDVSRYCEMAEGMPEQLVEIVKKLNTPITDAHLLMNSQNEAAIDGLIDYCMSLPEIQTLINEFKISRDDLKQLYWELLKLGAGQWTRAGHFVAASSLAYAEPLRYLLQSKKTGHPSEIERAHHLIKYFEEGDSLSMAKTKRLVFPWISAISLLYPLCSAAYISAHTHDFFTITGYGLANLGYAMGAAGILSGTYRIFGLTKRWQTLLFALLFFVLGTILTNVSLLRRL